MERKKSNNKTIFIIIHIIILLIICLLICANIFVYTKNKEYINTNIHISQEIAKKEIIFSNNKKEIDNLNQEINKINDLNNSIIKEKEDYYSNIRLLEDKILKWEIDQKIAYITIDDGPYQYTNQFLDILKKYNAPATFFVLLKPNRINEYKRMVNEGHTIANHTASHNLKKTGIYSSSNAFISDVNLLNNWLEKNVGVSTTLFRFPGGSPTAGRFKLDIANALKEKGYNYVDWNVIVGDGSDALIKQKRPYEWVKDQIKGKDIAVILMHDYCLETLQDLPKILQYLKDNGYLILPLTNKSIMVN